MKLFRKSRFIIKIILFFENAYLFFNDFMVKFIYFAWFLNRLDVEPTTILRILSLCDEIYACEGQISNPYVVYEI